MNSNLDILGLVFNLINYLFIFLFLFNLLKVNYYNSIVSIFVKIYKPISNVFSPLPNQAINVLFLAIIFKFLSIYICL